VGFVVSLFEIKPEKMAAQICIAVREPTTQKAVESVARAAEWADLVEVRADFIQDLDLELLLRVKPRPVIFTLRSREQGGAYHGSERRRLETILQAAQSGADYVDVEFSAPWQVILQSVPRERVILSHHDFQKTPTDLDALADRMAASGAGILKMAVRACCLADNVRVADLLERCRERKLKVCAQAMGNAGLPSRILGSQWGSWMAFASLPGGEETAEGQVPADVMTHQYRVREISHSTQLYAVVGKPLVQSLSPRIHNAAFAARVKDAVFLPLEAASFDDFLQFHARFPLRGVAVTIPYKGDAQRVAHSLSVAAEQTQAANTLILKGSDWHGENTDVEGFLRPLKRRVHPGKMRAVVLGAGGAARAVVYALRSQGASVCVVARDAAKARILASKFEASHAGWDRLESLQWDLLVNTTPVGMYPDTDESPVPAGFLTGQWVYDLVYNPAQTRLLKEAAQRGCGTIAGSEMFLGQAWKQQCLWCGAPPPENVMESALKEALAQPLPSLMPTDRSDEGAI
jgi:3-dehydroquinate dehydratase/shikimate dehydrogenase